MQLIRDIEEIDYDYFPDESDSDEVEWFTYSPEIDDIVYLTDDDDEDLFGFLENDDDDDYDYIVDKTSDELYDYPVDKYIRYEPSHDLLDNSLPQRDEHATMGGYRANDIGEYYSTYLPHNGRLAAAKEATNLI